MNVNRCTERDGVKQVFGAESAAGCYKGVGGNRCDDAVCVGCWEECAGSGEGGAGLGVKVKNWSWRWRGCDITEIFSVVGSSFPAAYERRASHSVTFL